MGTKLMFCYCKKTPHLFKSVFFLISTNLSNLQRVEILVIHVSVKMHLLLYFSLPVNEV